MSNYSLSVPLKPHSSEGKTYLLSAFETLPLHQQTGYSVMTDDRVSFLLRQCVNIHRYMHRVSQLAGEIKAGINLIKKHRGFREKLNLKDL